MVMMVRIQTCLIILFLSFVGAGIGSAEVSVRNELLQERTVILQREYLDGELSEEKIIELFRSIEEFKHKYKDWKIIEQTKDHIVLHKLENDISPLLKANGYFGMTADGTLSI